MKPEFEKFRTKSSGNPNSVRVPDELLNAIELIAKIEDDSFSGLVIEGLVRVLDDRRNDPTYMQSLIDRYESLLIRTSSVLGLEHPNINHTNS